ncbi:hypothetical protein KVR01_013805 [Diaporthe batatas]|uniref:uncharacterized protein n=1 Tax=Diaporthe batatas TaxID=748121 RepID=UPI001D0397F0|nr:uncharacterized protein KVR01_013805 [Diaporthe batatas]KAG8156353.1 hypothetical protein KVR01_013805 [Diaporthe batatas]
MPARRTTKPDPVPLDSPYKVGVELVDVSSTDESPATGGSESINTRPRANRNTPSQPPRSICFMVENCKWCRPAAQLASVPEEQVEEEGEEESPAVNALRECLETMERDRLRQAGARGAAGGCPGLVRRCLDMCGKASSV